MLNPNTIYRKTEAGVAEVQARALGLRAELRRLLILIDGVAPVGRLANFVRGAEIDFLIAELETQGLITAATLGEIARVNLPPPPPVRPPVPVAKNSPMDAPTGIAYVARPPLPPGYEPPVEPSAAQMQAVRRAAISTLRELLGVSAEGLAAKIERCRDAQEMRVTITEIRQNLERQLGAAVGQRFLEAVRGAAESTR